MNVKNNIEMLGIDKQPIKVVGSLVRALKKLHRCDIYHLERSNSTPHIYGVPNKNSNKYPDTPDISDVPCYFSEIEDKIPDTDDSHPNRTNYEVQSIIFTQDVDIRLNDKVVFRGDSYYLRKPEKIHNIAWEVIATRQAEV